jgi:PAS domain S-box-containing protein
MELSDIIAQHSELESYVGWTDADRERIALAAGYLLPYIPQIVDDFYDTLQRHPSTARVMTGGAEQIARLRRTLAEWLTQLLSGPYDAAYVTRRAQVGRRHAELGLELVYTNVAMARIRTAMTQVLLDQWRGNLALRGQAIAALNRRIDLDLAIMSAMYDAEHAEREKAALRRRLEGALHQEKSFSESVLAHAQAIVLVVDPQGRIVRYNAYLEQLAGRPQEPLCGQDWLTTFIVPADRPRLQRLGENVRTPPPAIASEAQTTAKLMTADGRPRTIRWVATPLSDAQGQLAGFLWVGHDVTDLLTAQEEALQAQRLATIGQVAAGLAHEARNALQRIQACAEMLELEVADRPEALDYVRRIEHAQSHLHQLFDEVRSYAAPIKLDRTPTRLSSIWREAWELLAPQRAGREVRLVEHDSLGDVQLAVDPFRLMQVFRNILENALAACQDPVEIHILCTPAQLGARRAVQIAFRDNGPGIPPDLRSRIFEPFFTTKSKGTGLGMAIAQRLVHAHGGAIEVGAFAPGAEIVVTLPWD